MSTWGLPDRARSVARKTRNAYLSEGLPGVARGARTWYRRRRHRSSGPPLPAQPVSDPGAWPLSVLILAERHLEQCYHYRVEQKQQILDALGVPHDVIGQQDRGEVLSRLQLASLLIVYRLPGGEELDAVLAEAHRLGVPVLYEVDDAVYRADLVAANPNLDTVPASLRAAVIRGAHRDAAALAGADANVASTPALAADMSQTNGKPAHVISNGIDDQMLQIADAVLQEDLGADTIVVTYGSGSRAHDHDFALAAPALARWLGETPQGRVKIIGPVRIPPPLQPLQSQIQRMPEPLDYPEYLRQLRRSTISIAPLSDDPFNHYKSHVKYLEAALVQVPLIASPTVYADYAEPGRTALIAADDEQWYAALRALSDDPALRARLAGDAREHVRRWELANEPSEQMQALLTSVGAWGGAR